MKFCWIRGLRPPRKHALDWRPVAANCLLSDFGPLATGARTAQAEAGLGFVSSTYFYVARVEVDFAEMVVAYRPAELPGAASPFDTGGVFHGHVAANPPWPHPKVEAIREFVRSNSHSLPATTQFAAWLSRAYSSETDYARGQKPCVLLPPLDFSRGDARAWTWEVRVPKAAARGNPQLERVFCSSTQQRQLVEWAQAELEFADCVRLTEILTQKATIDDPPTRVQSVIQWLEAP